MYVKSFYVLFYSSVDSRIVDLDTGEISNHRCESPKQKELTLCVSVRKNFCLLH